MDQSFFESIKEELISNLHSIKNSFVISEKLLLQLKDYNSFITNLYTETKEKLATINDELKKNEDLVETHLQEKRDNEIVMQDIVLDEILQKLKDNLKVVERELKLIFTEIISPAKKNFVKENNFTNKIINNNLPLNNNDNSTMTDNESLSNINRLNRKRNRKVSQEMNNFIQIFNNEDPEFSADFEYMKKLKKSNKKHIEFTFKNDNILSLDSYIENWNEVDCIKLIIKVTKLEDNFKKESPLIKFITPYTSLYICEFSKEKYEITISGKLKNSFLEIWEILRCQKELYQDFFVERIKVFKYSFFCDLIKERNNFNFTKTPFNNISPESICHYKKEYGILQKRRRKLKK